MADNLPQGTNQLDYFDFEIEIGIGQGQEYPVRVIKSPSGEARETMHFPYGDLALQNHLKDLQIALLKSGGKRRQILSREEKSIQDFGRGLFDALFVGEVKSRYDISRLDVLKQGKGLRLKLVIQPPELAVIPWEFLYDARQAEYITLSRTTPIVRYIELPHFIQPLLTHPPLRLLGMVASPIELNRLDVESEKAKLEVATQDLRSKGFLELHWLEGQTPRDLLRAMRAGPWHIFHFIGHGELNEFIDEGQIALVNEAGILEFLSASRLGRLLADHSSLRLVILNACEGARGSSKDIFSSTASILIRRGIPSVVAMQYEITDSAAIEFSRSLYEAITDGLPIDTAITEARKAMSLSVANSIEWGTPVLYMRSTNGELFQVASDMPATKQSADIHTHAEENQQHEPQKARRTQFAKIPSTIGLETKGGISNPLIQKGGQLPAQFTQIFSTAENGQTQVEINVLWGENELAKDNLSLGKFIFREIEPAGQGVPQIEIQFQVDVDLMLTISAKDQATGRRSQFQPIDLATASIPPPRATPESKRSPDLASSTTSYRTLKPEEYEQIFGDLGSTSDFFRTFFGGSNISNLASSGKVGNESEVEVEIALEEAFHGAERTLTSKEQKLLVKIPPGAETGMRIRTSGPIALIRVQMHPLFVRQGDDLAITMPIRQSFAESGGKIHIPTLKGNALSLVIPPSTSNNKVFRLSGQGMPKRQGSGFGDLYAKIQTYNPRNDLAQVREHIEIIKKTLGEKDIEIV